ncbi:flagellar protein FlaG protein [Shewanella denitrificans OS217]|jgi:flagellar protein FlaG|uniref:Flagellar protein FlaG protein n=1 Tax=Shewanella denitrificans (strain OS217 / ATCC BAA-1090 / DSM 15013) TaxID=318161 RepID=Q12PM4_SHEDO|nr:flagellar protein FlaG [Shewanella denitrificans]ABE54602.1 flagellar protein FlaG protein [Shewanella denitrificans OS217]
MDIGISTANVAAKIDVVKSETVKTELNVTPLAAQQSDKTELTRISSIQAVSNTTLEESEKKLAPEADLNKIAEELTDMLSLMRKGLTFSVDDDSGRQVISVKDIASGDLIRQIPSEEALNLAEKLSEFTGLLTKTEA